MAEWKWEQVKKPGRFTEWTLTAGNVLCRFWGKEPPSAHARLIAAAPELLEACEDIVAAFEIRDGWTEAVAKEMSIVRAAIAKAEARDA